MKLAHYNTSGKILGYYDSDIHSEEQIPSDVIEITNKKHMEIINESRDGDWKVNLETLEPKFVATSDDTIFYRNYEQKLSTVRNNAGDLIDSRFPVFEQVNLSNDTKTEIRDRQTDEYITQSDMNSLIQAMQSASDQKEQELEQIKTDYESGAITVDTAISNLDAVDVSESELKTIANW